MKLKVSLFFVSVFVALVFVIFGVAAPTALEKGFATLQSTIIGTFGWLYISAVGFFLFFVIGLAFGRYGSLKLGQPEDLPQFSYWSWFAMLFSAGMGIGLLFFSVAEPIMHFQSPVGYEPETAESARFAMRTTFFHWGLHAWAIYAVTGLALAFFSFRKKLPLTMRSTLFPVLGSRINGLWGSSVDLIAVIGTLFGVATSLGLGVMQINSGLDYLGVASVSLANQIWLIALITLMATASVVVGLEGGIRRLSEMNMFFGLGLLLFVLFLGPTAFLMNAFIQSVGGYLQNIVSMTFSTHAFQDPGWQQSWTMFYWGWWISWAPFVGMFIARISLGRTVREFVLGVLLVPTALTFVWITVFGGTALHSELFGAGGISAAVSESVPVALFVLLDGFPLAVITSAFATVVIATFFVTSSDSGSLVIDILTSNGNLNPPRWKRVFWAVLEGCVAAVLLIAGGLVALQTAAITTALPLTILLLVICYCLYVGMRDEVRGEVKKIPDQVDLSSQHKRHLGGL